MAQIHFEIDDTKSKQLKILALAKGVTYSSLVRSFVENGINEALTKKVELSETSLGSSLLKHNRQLKILHKNNEYCHSNNDGTVQTCTEYPKPKRQSQVELDELHKVFFAKCLLDIGEPLLYHPTGFAYGPFSFAYGSFAYGPFSLMVVANKDKLIEHMINKPEKKFRVYEALVSLIVDNMIRLKIITTITSITRGDFMACPLVLLHCIVKRATMFSSSSSSNDNDLNPSHPQIQSTATEEDN